MRLPKGFTKFSLFSPGDIYRLQKSFYMEKTLKNIKISTKSLVSTKSI